MTISVSDAIAGAALLFGIVNFVWAGFIAWQNHKRRVRDDTIKLSQLLDDTFDLLYGRKGYSKTKDSTKLSEAEKKIEQALRINPNDPHAVEYDGHLFELVGNTERALSRYRLAIKLDPKRARPHNCIGLLLMKGDDANKSFEEAKKSFERAICLARDRPALYHYNLGGLFNGQQDVSKAVSQLMLALKERPQYADALVLLGDILRAEKNGHEAQRRYEQAITADPNHIDALVQLGRLLSETPETSKEGMDRLEYAHKVDPRNIDPLLMMAAIYLDWKQPEQALPYCEKAMAIDVRESFEGKNARDFHDEILSALKAKSAAAESLPAEPVPVTEAGDAKLPEKKVLALALEGLAMIHFACPSCHKKLKAPESAAGKTTKCPTCGGAVPIPTASETPA